MPTTASHAPPAPAPAPTVDRPSPAGWRTWLPRVLVESVLIVFSVLLALAVDEWRQSRVDRQQAIDAHSAILEEIRSNRAAVAEALGYHSMLLDTLHAHGGEAWTPSIRLFSRGFISPAQLSHTAWTSASETGALSHMDYAAVLRLSRVYSQQDRYGEQSRSIGQLLYADLYRGGSTSIVQNHRNLSGIINTFHYRESELLTLYDETLTAMSGPESPR